MSADCPCCGDPRPPVVVGDLRVSLEEGASWRGRFFSTRGAQGLAILHLLARRFGKPVPPDRLYMAAIPEASETHLGVCIYNLRAALAQAGVPLQVVTEHRLGYRLTEA